MLWSKLFIPTLRDDPAEAKNAAHRLLIRAGYMRRQDYLFLGQRVLRKIAAIAREELDAIGAQEVSLASPVAVASELRSYKQLPQIWYQFNGPFAECWAFGSADVLRPAIRRVLDRCRVQYLAGEREFVAMSENGDAILRGASYAASAEMAESAAAPPAIPDPQGDLAPEEFHTPGQKTIADLSAFTALPETSQMKSVVMVADHQPVLALLRGDHQLSEAKLRELLSAAELRPANASEIREWFGADAGSLGPVRVANMPVLADQTLRGRRNMICGANRNDYHLRHVTPGEDFSPEFADLRMAAAGEIAPDGSVLQAARGITLARFARLRKSLLVTNEAGAASAATVDTARFFLADLISAAAEQQHDSDGLAMAIAPFEIVVTPVSNDAAQQNAARELYHSLQTAGVDALLDDRDERPGVKFKDADLIGIPYRVTVGKKLAQGLVEIRDRRARVSEDVPLAGAVSYIAGKIK